MHAPISVALIDDNLLVRDGLKALLTTLPDLVVVASAASSCLSVISSANPQVVLLDLESRDFESLRVAEWLKLAIPDAKVIGMDLAPFHEDLIAFVDAGVTGFLGEDSTLEDLARTIRTVAAGISVLPPHVHAAALADVYMTPREHEVIDLIAEGCSNKEIATRLRIAADTVKSHVRNVMAKLTLHTRLQIAAFAHRDRQL